MEFFQFCFGQIVKKPEYVPVVCSLITSPSLPLFNFQIHQSNGDINDVSLEMEME